MIVSFQDKAKDMCDKRQRRCQTFMLRLWKAKLQGRLQEKENDAHSVHVQKVLACCMDKWKQVNTLSREETLQLIRVE
jgi:hypothetical protein